jgi:hypothetical protein
VKHTTAKGVQIGACYVSRLDPDDAVTVECHRAGFDRGDVVVMVVALLALLAWGVILWME